MISCKITARGEPRSGRFARARPRKIPSLLCRCRRRRKPPAVEAGSHAGQANSFCARSVKKLASIEFGYHLDIILDISKNDTKFDIQIRLLGRTLKTPIERSIE